MNLDLNARKVHLLLFRILADLELTEFYFELICNICT